MVTGAHRAGEDDGARVAVVQREERGGLLQGVGAVHDDNTGDRWIGQHLPD